MNLNQAVTTVRELLLNPLEQEPNIRLVFGSILRETQNLYNELANSSVAWTIKELTVAISGSQTDYLVSGSGLGKVLFVTSDRSGYPEPVEFTDMADASRYWWGAATPGIGEISRIPDGPRVAFYRKDGLLYVRVAENEFSTGNLSIVFATGGWTDNIAVTAQPVLAEYQHLALIRAAMNLMAAVRWSDDSKADNEKASRQATSLAMQESRVVDQWNVAKRSLTADDVAWIENDDCYF